MKLKILFLLVALLTSSVSIAGFVNPPTPTAKGGTGQTTYTDGQLLIGNSSNNKLSKSTISAGTGITVTNGNGTIQIAATGTGSALKFFYVVSATGSPCSSSPCTISDSGGDITVSSLTRTGAGIYNINTGAGCTGTIACTASQSDSSNSDCRVNWAANSSTLGQVRCYDSSAGLQDHQFVAQCSCKP